MPAASLSGAGAIGLRFRGAVRPAASSAHPPARPDPGPTESRRPQAAHVPGWRSANGPGYDAASRFDLRRCPIGDSLLLLCLLLYLDASTLAFASTALLLIYGRFYEPWQVALAGSAASALGSATQLVILRWILATDKPWMRRFAPSRERLEAALRDFPSASFLALTVARATPLPDAPLKLVAATIGYPVPLYGLATFLGSIPYYFVLALIGRQFRIPIWVILAGMALVGLGIAIDAWRKQRRRRT